MNPIRPALLTFLPVVAASVFAFPASAQTALPPARVSSLPATLLEGAPVSQAAFLVDGALKIAASNSGARSGAVRGAAALLPRLSPDSFNETPGRDALTARWLRLAMSASVPRASRLDALDAFSDVAAKTDVSYAEKWAPRIPDPAARAGAYLDISRAAEAVRGAGSWNRADEYAALAQRAARAEKNLVPRARALTFVAYRMTELSPARQEVALREASSSVHLIKTPGVRDNLLAELTGAAARYDLAYGRRLASEISDEGLKNLAGARVNLAEVSQTTLTTRSKERITALAAAAAPYDSRALPVLLQLPGQPEVLKAIGDTLPRIYPSARPTIEVSQLETIWNYSKTAPEGAYRDQLQSRVARLMVLKDLWRGRSWGKELGWQGGRIQVGAFLNQVLAARRSNLGAGRLQDAAQTDTNSAYEQALRLPAASRAEALLLLAGQILG
ncbi:hypothetical protein [Abditibacterium utsteinense]|nr:hypothetical protein [Abditibacterium utsteinense]